MYGPARFLEQEISNICIVIGSNGFHLFLTSKFCLLHAKKTQLLKLQLPSALTPKHKFVFTQTQEFQSKPG